MDLFSIESFILLHYIAFIFFFLLKQEAVREKGYKSQILCGNKHSNKGILEGKQLLNSLLMVKEILGHNLL